MEECGSAFADDHDVTPEDVLDSGLQSPRNRSRTGRLTVYQKERLRLISEDVESRKEYRAEMLKTLRDIRDKW